MGTKSQQPAKIAPADQSAALSEIDQWLRQLEESKGCPQRERKREISPAANIHPSSKAGTKFGPG
jgi:hypothetical protein